MHSSNNKRKLASSEIFAPNASKKVTKVEDSSSTVLSTDRLCHSCNKNTSDWPDHDSFCDNCAKDFGCNDCWVENGMFCGGCSIFICGKCDDMSLDGISPCDVCFELYCGNCGDWKPTKHGSQQCSNCQPWFMKHRSANDFCKECASTRKDAITCEGCNKRVCMMCPFMTCSGCNEMSYCEFCNPMSGCEKCEKDWLCADCGCDCSDNENENENKDTGKQ